MGICEPEEDRFYMIAYTEAHNEMQAVENYELEQQMKKKNKAKGNGRR